MGRYSVRCVFQRLATKYKEADASAEINEVGHQGLFSSRPVCVDRVLPSACLLEVTYRHDDDHSFTALSGHAALNSKSCLQSQAQQSQQQKQYDAAALPS
jgi:hypothetical protein